MSNKITALLTTAIVSGLMAASVARAEDAAGGHTGDKMAKEKNNCKGKVRNEKNSCKGQKAMKKKKDKNSCKNGCSEKVEGHEKVEKEDQDD
ncbi:MAG: hypothetical protein COT73_03135 [Bdellovibrio sp. CG10_big_fil_rev_8_21_14_0_10_47_8]|nr:MAG: hypothetical protein COT73_03135 [Bdellovibrio sp. CG10_big_fil_rev_8_21_14_0_10_47_8]